MLYAMQDTGRSTVFADVAAVAAAEGLEVVEVEVEMRPLDDILVDAGLGGAPIHFCKIDVEGAEAHVLAGLDLSCWRPWILVVEATAPQSTIASHQDWEPAVLAAGYSFCLFDGLNRFYVADEHAELRDRLSYPACVFDMPFMRVDVANELERLGEGALEAEAARRSADEAHAILLVEKARLQADLAAARAHLAAAEALVAATQREVVTWRTQVMAKIEQMARLRQDVGRISVQQESHLHQIEDLQANLDAMQRTMSWRVTRPLRAVRRLQVATRTGDGRSPAPPAPAPMSPGAGWANENSADTLARRINQSTALLLRDDDGAVPRIGEALARFEDALERSDESDTAKSWLALTTANAAYPTEVEVQRGARLLRADGPPGLTAEMTRRFEASLETGDRADRLLHILKDQVVIDVSHTVAHDLHTGIQRVVREAVGRWGNDHDFALLTFDLQRGFAKALAPSETQRLMHWREHLHPETDGIRRPLEVSGAVVVPWKCQLLLPELVADPMRCDAYRALAISGVLRGLALIGFDFIPMTATETVTESMSANFANYLSVVKHADRLSAISAATARDFRAFNDMLGSQGLAGPEVVAHPLPTETPSRVEADIDQVRRELGLRSLPLVLAVGSHEPRKNHLVLLEAAHRLWRQGVQFHLLMIGGSGWRGEEFEDQVDLLLAAGHPLTVWKRASEQRLWASYHLARFSVFPSLVEGFGLPVAESLLCGTPVITSDFGSMLELAPPGGGAMTVDPRSVDAVVGAMHLLLTDDGTLAALKRESSARDLGTWDDYASLVWDHLTGKPASRSTLEC
jgi:glycosyltransferase involved in cell wall biosynthesis